MGRERKGLVLLAEDDPDQSEALGEYLQYSGYEVLLADSTLAVIQQLTKSPDVVLLDLNGIFSPALIRGLDALPNRPALILVSGDARIQEAAQRVRADAWLAKPYDLDELDDVLETALDARRMPGGALGTPVYAV
jgi:CheY-like chemotaxis protein